MKHQAPNPKLQRSSGIETPKTKLQTPKKSQVPSSKPRPALRAWSLELLWSLELGVWCLGLGASLELGAWNLELIAWALGLSKIEMSPLVSAWLDRANALDLTPGIGVRRAFGKCRRV